jgi:hypothetical protein
MLKSLIVKFLVHVLSYLVPVEDHLSTVIAKAASTAAAKDAKIRLKHAEKRANAIVQTALAEADSIQGLARAEYVERYRAANKLVKVPHVVTSEGAAAMVQAVVAAQAALPAV